MQSCFYLPFVVLSAGGHGSVPFIERTDNSELTRPRDKGTEREKCRGRGTTLRQAAVEVMLGAAEVAEVVGCRGSWRLAPWRLLLQVKGWATSRDRTAASWTAPCRYKHTDTHTSFLPDPCPVSLWVRCAVHLLLEGCPRTFDCESKRQHCSCHCAAWQPGDTQMLLSLIENEIQVNDWLIHQLCGNDSKKFTT